MVMVQRLTAGFLPGAVLCGAAVAQPAVGDPPSAVATPPASDDAERVPSFGGVFVAAGRDGLCLPSHESAIVLGVAGALGLSAHPFDTRVTRSASTSPSLGVFEAGAIGGGGVVQIGGALAAYAIGRGIGQPRLALTGADLLRAQIVAGLVTQGLKISVGRRRPDGCRFSFPSGHTSTTFATAAVLQRRWGWRLGVPAYGFGAYVAGSRLQENRHYLSDVLFGAGLGIIAGRTVTVGHGRGAGVVQPVAAPGVVGLTFSLVGAP